MYNSVVVTIISFQALARWTWSFKHGSFAIWFVESSIVLSKAPKTIFSKRSSVVLGRHICNTDCNEVQQKYELAIILHPVLLTRSACSDSKVVLSVSDIRVLNQSVSGFVFGSFVIWNSFKWSDLESISVLRASFIDNSAYICLLPFSIRPIDDRLVFV